MARKRTYLESNSREPESDSSTSGSDIDSDSESNSSSPNDDGPVQTQAPRVSQKRLPGQPPQSNATRSTVAGKRLPEPLPHPERNDKSIMGPHRLPSPIRLIYLRGLPHPPPRSAKRVRFSDPMTSETRLLPHEEQTGKAAEKWRGKDGTILRNGSGLAAKLCFWNSYQPGEVRGLTVEQARELLKEIVGLQGTLRELVVELEKVVERGDRKVEIDEKVEKVRKARKGRRV